MRVGRLVAFLVLPGVVWAQEAVPLPSDALRCLTPTAESRGKPEYPGGPLQRNENGRVGVELVFGGSIDGPEVRVLESRGDPEFVEVVRRYVSAYRVPCLETGHRVTLRQSFDFRVEGGRNVLASRPRERDPRANSLSACMTRPRSPPAYPSEALRRDGRGTVMMRLRFEAGRPEPTVTAVEAPAESSLTETAMRWAREIRVPCLQGEPYSMLLTYVFRIEGVRDASFKDMQLRDLLRASKGLDEAQAYFDTRTMGCPFDLKMAFFQPHMANSVEEVGTSDPERYFFLDWLSRLQLDLPAQVRNALYGRSATVHVPCSVVHLGAVGGGGAGQ